MNTTATASTRTSAPAASRGGGGIERGGSSGGSFGNSEKFKSSFSGKNLAKSTPTYTIGPKGSFSSSERQSPHPKSATPASFGVRLEAKGNISHDTQRPKANLNEGMRTIYSAKKDTKPGYVLSAKAKESPKTLTDIYGPKLDVTRSKTPEHSVTSAPKLKEMTPLYQSPADKKYHETPGHAKHHTVLPYEYIHLAPKSQPKAERQASEHTESGKKKAVVRQSAHQPEVKREVPRYTGERKVNPRSLQVSTEKTKQQVQLKRSENAPSIQTKEKKGVVMTTNEVKNLQNTKEQKIAALKQLQETAKPLQLQQPELLFKGMPEIALPAKPETAVQIAPTLRTTMLEQYPTLQTKAVEKAVVTHREQQDVLKSYTETYLPEKKQHLPQVEVAQRVDQKLEDIPEVKADVEQAIRVMHAYQAVIDSGAYTMSETSMKQTVLKALDQKLEKHHLKEQLVAETEVSKTTVVDSPVKSTVQEAEIVMQQQEVAAQPEMKVVPYLTEEQMMVPMVASVAETSSVQRESDTEQQKKMQTLTQAQTLVISTAHGQTLPQTEEDEIEEVCEEITYQFDMLDEYERDEFIDNERVQVAVTIAELLQTVGGEKISGKVLARTIIQIYEQLKSSIVDEDQPDDNWTDIIDQLAERDYESPEEVEERMIALQFIYPAIRDGEKSTVSWTEAQRLKASMRMPKAA